MVDKARILNILSLHTTLYLNILSKSEIAGDKSRAEYGLDEAKKLQKILHSNQHLKNRDIKEIYSRLTNMTRGVEYFEEYEMEIKKRELGKEIFLIMNDLKEDIKW